MQYYCQLGMENSHNIQLHEFLISNNINVRTIEYKVCYTRLQQIYGNEVSKEDIECLIKIGYERNTITHFGIYKELDYHKLISLIYRVLDFIYNFIIPKLGIERELKEDISKLKSARYNGELVEQSEWSKNTSAYFKNINEILEKSIKSIKESNIEIEFSYIEDEVLFEIILNKNYQIQTVNVPELDSIFLLMNMRKIVLKKLFLLLILMIKMQYTLVKKRDTFINALDSLVKINGIKRQGAKYSTAHVTFCGIPNTTITNGIVLDKGNIKWDLPNTGTISESGTVPVTATCEIAGPIVANVDGVTRFEVYENDTNETDSRGLPPHSITAVVENGADADIALKANSDLTSPTFSIIGLTDARHGEIQGTDEIDLSFKEITRGDVNCQSHLKSILLIHL